MNNQDDRDTLIEEILALTYYPNRNSAMAQRKAKEVVTLAESHIKQKIRTATLDDDAESVIDSLRDYKGFRHWHDDLSEERQEDVKQHAIDNLKQRIEDTREE